MYKKIALLIFFLVITSAFAQETVNRFPMKDKKDRDVFQIIDEKQKHVYLFISDKQNVRCRKMGSDMKIIDSLSTGRPEIMYTDMIGFNSSAGKHSVIWSDAARKDLYFQLFDFTERNVIGTPKKLGFKDEKILGSFSANDLFYILTVVKHSNVIKQYVFQPDGSHEMKSFDMKDFRFFDSDYKKTSFYTSFGGSFSMRQISSETPTSLTATSEKRKFYVDGRTVYLTFDFNPEHTQVLTIDLDKFTVTEKYISKPFIKTEERNFLNSNSFLMGNVLFQVKTNIDNLKLTANDLNGTLIKEYSVRENIPINFKNTEIVQENGSVDNTRTLENTSQLIRKINNEHIGLSGYELDGNYLLTIGSVSDEQSSAGGMYGAGMYGALGSIIASAIINPSTDNFNAYKNRRVVFVNSLFDKQGQHINGNVKPLAFEMIRKYSQMLDRIASETVFKFNGHYYFGFHNIRDESYILKKFTE